MKRALALTLALVAGGCGDDGPGADAALPCDIRSASCQRSVFRETARLRGQQGARLPPIRVITREQFASETRVLLSESRISRTEQIVQDALRLVAFLPPGSSAGEAAAESSIEGVAAYYHKRDRDVTIIEDAAEDVDNGTYTLSHEFVHALQDQREDLSKLDAAARDNDAMLAVDALVEGEAVVLSTALMAALHQSTPSLTRYDDLLRAFLDQIAMSVAPFTEAVLVLPYPIGGKPLAIAYERAGWDGIASFYRDRPTTFTAWVQGHDASLPAAMRCGVIAGPPGYERLVSDRFGGAGLLALYTRLGLDGREAFQAARAWTNDSFSVYGPVDEQRVATALAWRIALRDASAAAALAQAISAARLPLFATQEDAEVLLTATTDPAALAAWTARSECPAAPKGRVDGELSGPILPRPPYLP